MIPAILILSLCAYKLGVRLFWILSILGAMAGACLLYVFICMLTGWVWL